MSLVLRELKIGDVVMVKDFYGTYRVINKISPLIYDIRECYTRKVKFNVDIDDLLDYKQCKKNDYYDNSWDSWDNCWNNSKVNNGWDDVVESTSSFDKILNKYKNSHKHFDQEKKLGGGWVEVSHPDHNTYTYHESWLKNDTQKQQRLTDMWSKNKIKVKKNKKKKDKKRGKGKGKNKVVIDLTKPTKLDLTKPIKLDQTKPIKLDQTKPTELDLTKPTKLNETHTELNLLADVCSMEVKKEKGVEIEIEKPSRVSTKAKDRRYNLRRGTRVNYSNSDGD